MGFLNLVAMSANIFKHLRLHELHSACDAKNFATLRKCNHVTSLISVSKKPRVTRSCFLPETGRVTGETQDGEDCCTRDPSAYFATATKPFTEHISLNWLSDDISSLWK